MPLIGIKSKGSEFDAAVIDVDSVKRTACGDIALMRGGNCVARVIPDSAEIDDDLAELLRVYDAAQAKEKA